MYLRQGKFCVTIFFLVVGGVSNLAKAEVVTAEEVEGVEEAEGAGVVVAPKERM